MIQKFTFILLLTGFFFSFYTGHAQISQGGLPYSSQNPQLLKNTLVFEQMPVVDVDKLKSEDIINDAIKDIPWRFGENMDVDLNPANSGVWDILPAGDKVWRLGIRSNGALTINLLFSKYNLPPGSTLFIYNADKSDIIGAFTDFNNQPGGMLATTLVSGEQIVIEYYEPANPAFPGQLNLGRVTHGYRNAYDYAKSFGSSGSCNNNVNCPEAAGWENEIRSVCMLVTGGSGFCTGAVVNNTSEDGIPYVLTANHCYSDPTSWVFWFNWQSPTCSNPASSPTYNSVSGASLKARYSDSDFCLVQMSSTPPASYSVYYAGWNREDAGASSGAGVHHPSGDIKKISYSITSYTSDTWSGTPANSHWKVIWSDGITEPGSSGSPVFDQNHRLVGQLHGGPSSCTAADKWDFYGKFSMSWNQGATAASRLKDWLDPTNIAGLTLDGFDPYAVLAAKFTANKTITCSGSGVTFSDQSTGTPTSWIWTFTGGNPATYNGQNPPIITYGAEGTYDVSLTVSDGITSSTETKTAYITAKNIIADFAGTPLPVVIGNSVSFTDNSLCGPGTWTWNFPGGVPSTYTGQTPPPVTYNTLGTFDVILTVTNAGGTDTKTKSAYVTVTPPEFSMSNGNVTTCTGNFYDSGGSSGVYQDGENFTDTFYPSTPGSMTRFTFNSFSTESGYDYLRIYNGTSTADPLIGTYHGTTGPGTVTASNPSGTLTFNFTSDGSITSSGWSAAISCYSSAIPPVAQFAASANSTSINTTVSLTDQSENLPTSWAWSISPGTFTFVGGTNSGSQNPQVQFTATGQYTVTLTVANAYGSDAEIKPNYINVTNCTPCATSFSNLTDDFISNVTLNTINNNSGSTTYSDFTTISTSLLQGSGNSISVSVTVNGAWVQHCIVWVDWNNNCSFADAGETFDLGQTPGTAGTFVLTGTITVPSDALPGSKRMRISERYNQNPGPCDVATYGEPEDYTITVQGTEKTLNLSVFLEGLFNGTNMNKAQNSAGDQFPGTVADQITVELHSAASPFEMAAGPFLVNVNTDGTAILSFPSSLNSEYYIVIKHRNSIETWSAIPVSMSASVTDYDFSASAASAFGDNLKLVLEKFVLYGGDVNQDGIVDSEDIISADNDAANFLAGYLVSDADGNGLVNSADLILLHDNAAVYVSRIRP